MVVNKGGRKARGRKKKWGLKYIYLGTFKDEKLRLRN